MDKLFIMCFSTSGDATMLGNRFGRETGFRAAVLSSVRFGTTRKCE
jgi:hypothetical protein